jgi:Domain of unknown function (DUF4386)
MTSLQNIVSNKKMARIAGVLYLVVVLSGIFSLAYVPTKLIVWDNAAATFNNLAAHQTLFRFGIVSGLICYTFFLFLPLALYKLLKPVNENYAKLMVILAVVSIPISFINIQNKLAAISLISDTGYLKVFTNEQLQAQVLFYLKQYDSGILIVEIFWGLWLFPFGYLVYKSGFLPKILGVFLMLACCGYLINFLGNSLIPNYSKTGVAFYIGLPATIGEIGICLWLLIMGAIKSKPHFAKEY